VWTSSLDKTELMTFLICIFVGGETGSGGFLFCVGYPSFTFLLFSSIDCSLFFFFDRYRFFFFF